MNKTINNRWLIVSAAALTTLITATATEAQLPTVNTLVTVTVHVRTADETAIAEAPVQVYTDDGVAFGFTDATGTVTFTIELGPDDPDIVGRLWDGSFHQAELTLAERQLAASRYESLLETYYISPHYFALTVPGQTRYQIDIVGQPAVQATGRLVNDQGQPIDELFDFWVRGGAWHGGFREGDGLFTIHSIPQGEAVELWLGVSTPQTQIVALSALQTAENIDLGDIVVQIHDRPVPLEMTITNAARLYDPGDVALWQQVSLIRDDAQVLLTFPVKPPDGEVVAKVASVQTDVPRTTAGVYYIVPGGINTPTALKLLDALRAGQHAQLDAAGAAKIVAIEGQTTEFTLNAREARDAILAATGQGP